MLWLAVYFPHWLLQYQSYHQGIEPGAALALYERQSSQILLSSQAAASQGVEVGQSIATAQTLCPSLQLLTYDNTLSQSASDWLCQWSYAYSARVVPMVCPFDGSKRDEQPQVTDTLLLEVGSMVKVFGSLKQLLRQYHSAAVAYGLKCQFALAQNPLLAQLGARYQPMSWPERLIFTQKDVTLEVKAVEEVAQAADAQARVGEEENIQQVLPQVTLMQLAPLAISALPLPLSVQRACENMGLTQTQELLALPLSELGERFGEAMLTLLAQLKGQLPQVHRFYQPPESYQHKLALLYEVSHLEGLAFPLSRMLATLSSYLMQRQQAVLALRLTLVFRDLTMTPLRSDIRYPFAEHRADALLKLCRVQLDSLSLAAPVISLEVEADTLVALAVQTPNWYQSQGKSDASMRLLSLLEARLGAEKVKGVSNCSHHLPEHSWQSRSFSQWRQTPQGAAWQSSHECAEPKASYQGKTRALSESAGLQVDLAQGSCDGRIRPSWLLRQPEPILPEQVTLLKGPERLLSPWGNEAPRDYYLAQMEQGGLCWVFRTPQGLFLQGWFA
ncbi:Y-family DNA polymerase [Shewanella marisflavi]|uniref:Y-family DNA polymerase n=1 Tax=Shewanella marisflavi TaxID=260364 RepID=UPI003AAFBFC2